MTRTQAYAIRILSDARNAEALKRLLWLHSLGDEPSRDHQFNRALKALKLTRGSGRYGCDALTPTGRVVAAYFEQCEALAA